MVGFEFVFVFGLFIGGALGMWIGGRYVLYRMHHDDVESAHSTYKRRKDKYINKTLK